MPPQWVRCGDTGNTDINTLYNGPEKVGRSRVAGSCPTFGERRVTNNYTHTVRSRTPLLSTKLQDLTKQNSKHDLETHPSCVQRSASIPGFLLRTGSRQSTCIRLCRQTSMCVDTYMHGSTWLVGCYVRQVLHSDRRSTMLPCAPRSRGSVPQRRQSRGPRSQGFDKAQAVRRSPERRRPVPSGAALRTPRAHRVLPDYEGQGL